MSAQLELITVPIEKPEELNLILGQAHFIKTVEDLYEALAGSSPHLRFGLAFCESSGPRLVRRAGNDEELVELAIRNALAIGAGHSFVVFLREGYPVNVLNQVKQVPEVCRIYCAPGRGRARTDAARAGDPRCRRWRITIGRRDRGGRDRTSRPAAHHRLQALRRTGEARTLIGSCRGWTGSVDRSAAGK